MRNDILVTLTKEKLKELALTEHEIELILKEVGDSIPDERYVEIPSHIQYAITQLPDYQNRIKSYIKNCETKRLENLKEQFPDPKDRLEAYKREYGELAESEIQRISPEQTDVNAYIQTYEQNPPQKFREEDYDSLQLRYEAYREKYPELKINENPLDETTIKKVVQKGRHYPFILMELGLKGFSKVIINEIAEHIFNRLHEGEFKDKEMIHHIIAYLCQSYNYVNEETKRKFFRLKTFYEANIKDPDSIERHIQKLILTANSNGVENSHQYDLLPWAQTFKTIYLHMKAMQSNDDEIIREAIKLLSQEIGDIRLSLKLLTNRAIDREIVKKMIETQFDGDKVIESQINDATINEGLCRPILTRSILKDLEIHEETSSTVSTEGSIGESDEAREGKKEINFFHLNNILKTASILRTEQEAQTNMQKLHKLNVSIQKDSDLVKTVKMVRGFAEIVGAPNEIINKTTSIIDNANTIHNIAINVEKTAKSIGFKSGILSMIAGGLNILFLPLKYAFVKKRWPNTAAEWGKIGLSITLVILGAIAFANVGGAAAAGGLFLAISTIGYVQAVLDADKINRKLLTLKKTAAKQKNILSDKVKEINALNEKIQVEILELQSKLQSRPDEIDFETIESLTNNINQKISQRQTKFDEYVGISTKYLSTQEELKKTELKKSQASQVFKRFGNVAAGALAVAGAVAMFFLPPVGAGLLIASAVLSLTTILTEIGVGIYHARKEKQIKKECESLEDEFVIRTPDADLFKAYDIYKAPSNPNQILKTHSHTIDHNLMGSEISQADCPHEKQKVFLEKTPFSKLFTPAPPEIKVQENGDDEGERRTLGHSH